jgi:hypothetical protein
MSDSIAPGSARSIAAGVGYLAKSPGVTRFTRSSVHCAERIVAIRSSNGFACVSAHSARAYSFLRIRAISEARSRSESGGSGEFREFFSLEGTVCAI